MQNSQGLATWRRQTLVCLQNHWCHGGNRQHLMEHCPASPSCLHQLPRGTWERSKKRKKRGGKKPEERLKEEWERGASRRQGERDSTRWIMQSCQRQLLLEVLAALKGASADLQRLPSHCSPRLRAAWSVLQQMVNKMRWRVVVVAWGRRGWGWVGCGDRWIVLEGHTGNDQYALYYGYLQRSPTGRSELTCTGTPAEI